MWSLTLFQSPSITSSSSCSSCSIVPRPCVSVRRRYVVRCGSFLDSDEDDDGAGEVTQGRPNRFHVLGLGQAMVDFSGMVEESFLSGLGVEKGSRKVVNHEERGRVLRAMDGRSYKAAAGGSLSNTLVALARLSPSSHVGMAASIGTDPLGAFFRSKLARANVHVLAQSQPDDDTTTTTGTVIVLTTPDAQRTMLSFQASSPAPPFDHNLASLVSLTRILVIEGYLFGLPDALPTITRAAQHARHSHSHSLVALTASDVSTINSHFQQFWDVASNYAHILFANTDEARALCGFGPDESAEVAARYLSRSVPLVSVTDGARGSYIGYKGEAIYIEASPCVAVDTCGAGDAYAAGILYGILRGRGNFSHSDLPLMGLLASRVAATVVAQQGTRLSLKHATRLANSYMPSQSDHISSTF